MSNETIEDIEQALNLNNIINFLKETPEEAWLLDKCREISNGATRNCLRGHLSDYATKNKAENYFEDLFHELYCTEFMYYLVNDGENPKYQQPTPKQRVIAYLENIKNGTEKTTQEPMEEGHL